MIAGDFDGRRAPYAPISALERFFERIRDRSVPDHVDHKFLQKLNVASNNEYSLLSALKFLGILDDHGRPTHSYRLLQSTDGFQDALRHLVETAYRAAFEAGVDEWSIEDQVNYFRRTSSASQAKNAARFFRAVSRLAGVTGPAAAAPRRSSRPETSNAAPSPARDSATNDLVLAAKAKLLEKLPAPRPDWSAQDYRAICEAFLEMLQHLET
jgi:hypothetical protein